MRAAKAQMSLRNWAVSPEPFLLPVDKCSGQDLQNLCLLDSFACMFIPPGTKYIGGINIQAIFP